KKHEKREVQAFSTKEYTDLANAEPKSVYGAWKLNHFTENGILVTQTLYIGKDSFGIMRVCTSPYGGSIAVGARSKAIITKDSVTVLEAAIRQSVLKKSDGSKEISLVCRAYLERSTYIYKLDGDSLSFDTSGTPVSLTRK